MTVGTQNFSLRSVVAVETAPNDANLIISCCALVVLPEHHNIDYVLQYSPLDLTGEHPDKIEPLQYMPFYRNNFNKSSMYLKASTKGTIFVYTCTDTNNSKNSFFTF
jgi:hypothetical protein